MNKFPISKKAFWYYLIITILVFLFSYAIVAMITFLPNEEGEYVDKIIGVVLASINTVILVISIVLMRAILKRKLFYEENGDFILERGLIFKKRIVVPYNNIHTVGIKRSLLARFFKLSIIEIDTGTTAKALPEARIELDRKYALVLKEFLENRKKENINFPSPYDTYDESVKSNAFYSQKTKKNISYSLIKEHNILIFIGIFIYMIFIGAMGYFFNIGDTEIEPNTLPAIIFAATFISIILLLLFLIGQTIGYALRFYQMQLKIEEDYLEVSYGFFNKTSFQVNKKRINAIIIKQSLLQRAFKNYNLELAVLGIGDVNTNDNNQSESRKVLINVKKDIVDEVIARLYQDASYERKYYPKKNRFLNFYLLPLLIPIVIFSSLIILSYNYNIELFAFSLVSLILILGLITLTLNFVLRRQAYNISLDYVIAETGSFTKKIYLIPKKRIQQILYRQNLIQLPQKIGHIRINYKRNFGLLTLKHFDNDDFNRIKEAILK